MVKRKGEFKMKKVLKAGLVFIISSVILYLVLTLTAFYGWGKENQIWIEQDKLLVQLDPSKIQELGDLIGTSEKVLKQSLEEARKQGEHTLAEYYDPLGFSVWRYLQMEMQEIVCQFIVLSILLGGAITIAYLVITSKKMNYILKIAIGYFGVMLLIPPIYMYSWTYRFWDVFLSYKKMPYYFYIGYTIVFIVMYVVNYRIGVKMTKELNQIVKNEKE